tara:strand:- start:3312 stop:4148 length:837 start_codon:yes stop_codon:yes gene_type:complete
MDKLNFDSLLKSGVHFGHLSKKWNPKMSSYIFMKKNGIHIIDLNKTILKMQEASAAIKQIVKSGKKILFVATKKQAKSIIEENISSLGMPYVVERWPGGMLTNFITIRKAVKKMNNIDTMFSDGTANTLSKKERLFIQRERQKLEKNFGSISDLKRLPQAIFIVDVNRENIAVKEAKKIRIPIFGIVDTNSDPSDIDFPIPGNDDSRHSIELIVKYIASSIKEGLEEYELNKKSKKENNSDKVSEKKNDKEDVKESKPIKEAKSTKETKPKKLPKEKK